MKMKKLAAALLAAAVLATTVAPTATPVFAATTAETTATDATPEQEVTVKKPAKATVAAKNNVNINTMNIFTASSLTFFKIYPLLSRYRSQYSLTPMVNSHFINTILS